MSEKTKDTVAGIITVLVVVVLWHLFSVTGVFGKFDSKLAQLIIPSPISVGEKMLEMIMSGYLLESVWTSLQRVISGFLISVLIGIPIGIIMGVSKNACRFIYPIFKIIAPIPGVAWIPLAIIWFGLGNRAAIFIIAASAITPIVINTMQGVSGIDKNLEDLLHTFHANIWQKIIYMIIPSVIPYMITGFKLGLGYAWRVVIAAEMVGVPGGLGYVLSLGRSTAQTEITFIIIIVLSLLLVIMEKCLFTPLEYLTEKWKYK